MRPSLLHRAAARLSPAFATSTHIPPGIARHPCSNSSIRGASNSNHSAARRGRGLSTQAVPFPIQQPARVDVRAASSVSDSLQQQRPSAFKKQGIMGDGSCMFRAVVQGHYMATHGIMLSDSEEKQQALALRKDVVEELKKRREDIEPFLPGIADDFDEYLNLMSQPGVWGGEPELVMAAHVLQRPIAVYQSGWRGPEFILQYGDEYAKAADPLHLLWSGAHYDLLLPVTSSRL